MALDGSTWKAGPAPQAGPPHQKGSQTAAPRKLERSGGRPAGGPPRNAPLHKHLLANSGSVQYDGTCLTPGKNHPGSNPQSRVGPTGCPAPAHHDCMSWPPLSSAGPLNIKNPGMGPGAWWTDHTVWASSSRPLNIKNLGMVPRALWTDHTVSASSARLLDIKKSWDGAQGFVDRSHCVGQLHQAPGY